MSDTTDLDVASSSDDERSHTAKVVGSNPTRPTTTLVRGAQDCSFFVYFQKQDSTRCSLILTS